MWFSINFHSHTPVYVQIKEKIKEMILNGSLKSGEFIPSIRTLSKDLEVNLNTVARAYRELEQEGVIKVERGEGYVVVGVDENEIKNKTVTEFKQILIKLNKVGFNKEEILKIVDATLKDILNQQNQQNQQTQQINISDYLNNYQNVLKQNTEEI